MERNKLGLLTNDEQHEYDKKDVGQSAGYEKCPATK
jgi:hypothetical protein